ncbi:MAG: hypothetical protein KC731_26905, partial [Myxococcales bacterium]|nr:hypothetical protein [Myxococcales bacterium]
MPDRVVGSYRLKEAIPASAGLGTAAHLGRHRGDGTPVLAQRIDGADHSVILRELAAAAAVTHPSLARPLEWFEEDGAVHAVFEHVDGLRLDQLLDHLRRNGLRLPDVAIFELGAILADALARAQEARDDMGRGKRLVHGTLAPDRIAIGWNGRVVIYGTGLPRLFPDEGRDPRMGPFRAPELRRVGAEGTSRGDVFALARILHALFTGEEPGPSPAARLATARADLPDEVVR